MTNREKEIKKFLNKTTKMVDQLIYWKFEAEVIEDIEISNMWMEFSNLYNSIRRENICNEIILEQYKIVIQAFKLFQDRIKIFKTLPDY